MRSVLLVLFFVGTVAQAAAPQPPAVIGRSWIIGDLSSDQILASEKPDARIGMKNTHFTNSTGVPDAQHYSTAQDLYLLAAALIRDFPAEYAQYYSQKEFRYNDITQPNRNRLLWLDPTVDGVKTGHTEAAGFCLIASSRRG